MQRHLRAFALSLALPASGGESRAAAASKHRERPAFEQAHRIDAGGTCLLSEQAELRGAHP